MVSFEVQDMDSIDNPNTLINTCIAILLPFSLVSSYLIYLNLQNAPLLNFVNISE